METVLDTGSLLERYGTLKQFVAKNSIEDEFSFSFQRKMSTINDEVEIKITVRVNENNIKDARIKLIEMRSIKSNTTIFKIEHNTNLDSQYHIKIDLIFFREAFNVQIKNSIAFYNDLLTLNEGISKINQHVISTSTFEISLKEFNDLYNTNYRISKDRIENFAFYNIDTPSPYGISKEAFK